MSDAAFRALFEARHRHGRRIDQPAVVAEVLTELGIDVSDLMRHVDDGTAPACLPPRYTVTVTCFTLVTGVLSVTIQLREWPRMPKSACT